MSTGQEYCDVCAGLGIRALGVQVEVREPHHVAIRVCRQGHGWVTTPVPAADRDDEAEPVWCENAGCGSGVLLDDRDECPYCGWSLWTGD